MRISPSAWRSLQDAARGLGFVDLGAAPAGDLVALRRQARPDAPATTGLPEWLEAGHAGEMGYIGTTAADRMDPRRWWPQARTALVGLVGYDAEGEPGDARAGAAVTAAGPRGRVSRYAWGRDYHLVVKAMLKALGRLLEREVPGASWRTSVDRTAVMEKPFAVLAGLGWIGRHGNLLRTDGSSWHFIGALFTDAELEPEHGVAVADHCGTCTACVDACPTGAIVAPQVVDARRCISYLTIEIEGASDPALRPATRDWVYGCDACQDACPWNRHRARAGHPRFGTLPLGAGPALLDLLRMDDAAFTAATPKSAVKRAGRDGLVRNAATAAGNSGDRGLVPALADLLRDRAPAVRAHAAWALGRLGGAAAREALGAARGDADPAVRAEVEAALAAAAV